MTLVLAYTYSFLVILWTPEMDRTVLDVQEVADLPSCLDGIAQKPEKCS